MGLLEDKIRNLYAQQEALDGHRERFMDKIAYSGTRHIGVSKYIAYAASVVLLIALTIVLFTSKNEQLPLILATEGEEYVESELYYQRLIEEKMSVIHGFNNIKGKHLHDINKFDESLKSLKMDLEEVPGDQRVVDAVLNTYMLKIEALDNLVVILTKSS